MLSTYGLGDNSAGFAILAWAIVLKILTTPFYEAAVKEPIQFTSNVTDYVWKNITNKEGEFDERSFQKYTNIDTA